MIAVQAALSEVVLRDPAHSASLIYDRTAGQSQIVETETWSVARVSRIIKSTYDESGNLTARTIAVTRGVSTQRNDATITPAVAIVTSTARNGQGPPSSIPIGHQASIADPSLLWFVKTHPDKGTSITFKSFDPEYRYWEDVTVTFEGRGKIGDSPEGNLVTRKTARSVIHLVLDDNAMPLVWDEGRLHLVREPAKKPAPAGAGGSGEAVCKTQP
ncbi:MAG TPA: hypothetical protein VMI31_18155 [Fimbriimonadaceae bacterium]|nr:hypothetical protein [Fimbriimonadaceae bacterium]